MAHDTTHIFVNGTVGISLADIAYVLADNTDMARSSKINRYAKYKPCGGNKVTELTEEERKNLNCGIDCSDTSTGCFSTNLSSLLTRAKASADWNKVPIIVSRVLDFDGYYHLAQPPYVPQSNKIGNTTGDGEGSDMYINLTLTAVIETGNMRVIDLQEALTRQGDAITDFKFGLLYRNINTPNVAPTLIELDTIENLVTHTGTIPLQVRFAAPTYDKSVNYDCVFIAYVEHNNNTYWATFLPNTFFQINLAYFSVTVNGTPLDPNDDPLLKLEFGESGGSAALIVSGYNWLATWPSKGTGENIDMTLTPSQSTGTVRTYDNVVLDVGNAIPNQIGSVEETVSISAPSEVRDITIPGGDFVLKFIVHQTCPYNNFIYAIDSDGNRVDIIAPHSLMSDDATTIRIKSNVPWRIVTNNIVYDDDYVSDQPTDDLAPQPVTGGSSGETITSVDIVNTRALTAGRRYKIPFTSTDATKPVTYVLRLRT